MSYYIKVLLPPQPSPTECISTVQSLNEEKMMQLIIAGAHPLPFNYTIAVPRVVYGICQPSYAPPPPSETVITVMSYITIITLVSA